MAVWAFTAFIVSGVALSALSEAFEGILPLSDALLPNAVYRFHATLQVRVKLLHGPHLPVVVS